jgi:diaminopimelate decarboxylase
MAQSSEGVLEPLRFLTSAQVREIAEAYGTPVYLYDEQTLLQAAREVLDFPHAFGLTARYAMKANPNAAILKIFTEAGLHIDASSAYEVARARRAGVPAEKIMLTSQSLPYDLGEIVSSGVRFNATSLHQLELFSSLFPGGVLGLRINPGLGSGGTNRTNVGGPASSFGIWHEDIGRAKEVVRSKGLKVETIHTHIGSGSDPVVWQKVAGLSISLLEHFPDAVNLNLGGGFKVGRMSNEVSTDLQTVGLPVVDVFRRFAESSGRKIHLQIEPGTYLVANAGCIIVEIVTLTSTGAGGYQYYKLNCGMTEILRPSLYGAQHPLTVVARNGSNDSPDGESIDVVVVGHCCESGDILTPMENDPEGLKPRKLRKAVPGDYLVIGGAGAYCSAMSAKNYNSFPEAAEVLLRKNGEHRLIRRRQTVEQMLQNEIPL